MQLAIVKKNRLLFTDEDMTKYLVPVLYKENTKELKQRLNDYIWSVLEPHITFITVNPDNLFETVCPIIAPNDKLDDFLYMADNSFAFPNKYIQCMYVYSTNSNKDNLNQICCYLSIKHTFIENTAVLCCNKYDLVAPEKLVLDSVTKKDIIKAIRNRYFYSAILVKENRRIKYYYQNVAYLIKTIFGNIEHINNTKTNFCGYNLSFYFIDGKSEYLNQSATRINGAFRLHGDVLVLQQDQKDMMASIATKEYNKIDSLTYCRLYDRDIKEHEQIKQKVFKPDSEGVEHETTEIPSWNKHIVLMMRDNPGCINCGSKLINPIICTICYRARYCSEICKKEYDHDDECINPKSYR